MLVQTNIHMTVTARARRRTLIGCRPDILEQHAAEQKTGLVGEGLKVRHPAARPAAAKAPGKLIAGRLIAAEPITSR